MNSLINLNTGLEPQNIKTNIIKRMVNQQKLLDQIIEKFLIDLLQLVQIIWMNIQKSNYVILQEKENSKIQMIQLIFFLRTKIKT